MELPGAFNVIFWIGLTVFVIFGVVFPSLVFLAAALEKQHVTTLRPLAEAQRAGRGQEPPESLSTNFSQDDWPLGVHGYCDAGKKATPMFLLLSGDGLVLVRVWLKKNDAVKRYELMSRLHSGPWLVTSDMLPFRDMAGLRWEEVLPDAPLSMALYHHRRRIGQAGQPSVSFDPETVLDELAEHERQRVARLVERGLARYVGPERDKWVYTIRGSAKLARQTPGIMSRLREDQKHVEALKREAALPLTSSSASSAPLR